MLCRLSYAGKSLSDNGLEKNHRRPSNASDTRSDTHFTPLRARKGGSIINSVRNTRRSSKPTKPYPDFPLFAHATGRWAKKILGRLHYFGPWRDPEGALQRYLDQKDELYAGRTPRAVGDGLTVRGLLNHFLTSKRRLVDSGDLVPVTFEGYHTICKYIAKSINLSRLVSDLTIEDFERLRSDLANIHGPTTLSNDVTRGRTSAQYGGPDIAA